MVRAGFSIQTAGTATVRFGTSGEGSATASEGSATACEAHQNREIHQVDGRSQFARSRAVLFRDLCLSRLVRCL